MCNNNVSAGGSVRRFPWCSTKQMECDSLAGSDNLTGVTAAMGKGCCAKYKEDSEPTLPRCLLV